MRAVVLAGGFAMRLRPYTSEGGWFDLGTISEYERAVAELDRRGGTLM
jgi:NDP-sugar pyrophosphorylase family protein